MATEALRRLLNQLDKSLGATLTISLFFNFYFSFYFFSASESNHVFLETSSGGGACICSAGAAVKSRLRPNAFPIRGPMTWECLPSTVQSQFTLGGKIPVSIRIIKESSSHKFEYTRGELEEKYNPSDNLELYREPWVICED